MNDYEDIILLAEMLETEYLGGKIDRSRMAELASRLLPKHPEIRHTLTSICDRMAGA